MQKKVQKLASYKKLVERHGTPISKEQLNDITEYSKDRGIRLSGFKHFIGDIEIIKLLIDDLIVISKDFPLITSAKKGITLSLDYEMGTDFATTIWGHTIQLNAVYFSDIEMLTSAYNEAVDDGLFVKGTDWHSVIRHETGHVVSNIYHINPLKVAKEILKTDSSLQVLSFVKNELSLYAIEFEDGREIISESFSGYYSNVGNSFANSFVEKCIEIVSEKAEKEANNYETL